ncbi:hypothetical protein NU08_2429 [Flavobacterium anhuiense]|uniref:Uncharacterized protein n=1 Tax=Flavobacterium anhuiense TaxID=459526 RepID=A0A444VY61_9FLAO|nr:hypothetical protein NU08_2429 [Flavobacterium anhuiense]
MPNRTPIKRHIRTRIIWMVTIISVTAIHIRWACIWSISWTNYSISVIANMNAIVNININVISVSVNRIAAYISISVAYIVAVDSIVSIYSVIPVGIVGWSCNLSPRIISTRSGCCRPRRCCGS